MSQKIGVGGVSTGAMNPEQNTGETEKASVGINLLETDLFYLQVRA
jgi:hypothetical protein